MLNIALSITGIVVFNALLSLIGHAAITNGVYGLLFSYVAPSEGHKRQATLKREILAGRKELNNTSAQDDFAKWAKIRRRVDKQVAELEALTSSLAAHKSKFGSYSKGALFLVTSGLQWWFTTRHRRAAIVYLPKEWFGPLTWFLGLPFAPTGALSCGVYIFLVKRVMGILTRVMADVWAGIRGEGIETPAAAVPMDGAGTAKQRTTPVAAGDATKKKEL